MRSLPAKRAACVFLLSSAVLLCGAKCGPNMLIVEDAKDAWEKSPLDPALAGRWKAVVKEGEKEPDEALAFVKNGDAYDLAGISRDEKGAEKTESGGKIKTIAAGPHRFLMWREWEAKATEEEKRVARGETPESACALIRYSVEKDMLTLSFPADDVLEKAFADEKWKGVLTRHVKKVEVPAEPLPTKPGEKGEAENKEEDENAEVWMTRLDEKGLAFLKWLADDPVNWESFDHFRRAKEEKEQVNRGAGDRPAGIGALRLRR